MIQATHLVKFWRLETLPVSRVRNREEDEWICFKSFYLQSRASALKFDSKYLLTSTYFLTMDLYSIDSQTILCQFMGHTCSITAFDFMSADLGLICTGSADNSIKYWMIPSDQPVVNEEPVTSLAIKTEVNLLWPVKITIEKLSTTGDDQNEYLILALCANGYLFLNLVQPGNIIS